MLQRYPSFGDDPDAAPSESGQTVIQHRLTRVVCAWCRKTRTAAGDWLHVRHFIPAVGGTSHGICPDCSKRLA